jgi:hypothetical protein
MYSGMSRCSLLFRRSVSSLDRSMYREPSALPCMSARATCLSSAWRSISARISVIVRRFASQSFIKPSKFGADRASSIASYTRSLPSALRMSSSFRSRRPEELIRKRAKALGADEDELLAEKVPDRIRKRVLDRPDAFGKLARLNDKALDRLVAQIEE